MDLDTTLLLETVGAVDKRFPKDTKCEVSVDLRNGR